MTDACYQALRMLKLLEEHHHRLAEIIKTKHVIAKQLDETGDVLSQKTGQTEHTTPTGSLHAAPDASAQNSRASSSALSKMQQQRRDTSPALAKDMASRRGIPQPQTRKIPPPIVDGTSVHASDSRSQRKPTTKQRAVRESPSAASASTAQLEQLKPNPAEDGFSRFYSTLTSGPFSKISSMLAFAALPLNESTSQPSSPTSSRTEKTARAHDGPDIRKLISPAAMNALEEGQRRQGHSGQPFGGESFYVVPPSGGTTSYANIMRTEQRYARRQGHLSNISEEDNEFVDARETQNGKNSGGNSLSTSHGKPGVHRVEELELENDSLKQVLDQMCHRLQAFERSAQDASMAALTQSMASVRTTGGGDVAHGDRTTEDELQKAAREITKLRGQNQKYKSYLERLKDSARQKEREKRERGEGPA